MPDRFESGTPNIPGMAGLLHALNYLNDSKTLLTEAGNRSERFLKEIRNLKGFKIIGHPEEYPEGIQYTRVISILPEDGNLTELTSFLNTRDIAVRSGLHCAPGAHKTLMTFDQGGTLRLSPGLFTTERELKEFIETLKEYRWLKKQN
jgi:selenocysteine lyase/cysteine desulfurase